MNHYLSKVGYTPVRKNIIQSDWTKLKLYNVTKESHKDSFLFLIHKDFNSTSRPLTVTPKEKNVEAIMTTGEIFRRYCYSNNTLRRT